MSTIDVFNQADDIQKEVKQLNLRLHSTILPMLKLVGLKTYSLQYLGTILNAITDASVQVSRFQLTMKRYHDSLADYEEVVNAGIETSGELYRQFNLLEKIKVPKKYEELQREVKDELFNMMTVIPRTLSPDANTIHVIAKEFSTYSSELAQLTAKIAALFQEETVKKITRYEEICSH